MKKQGAVAVLVLGIIALILLATLFGVASTLALFNRF